MLTVQETAKRLNVHERTVYNWINSNKLLAKKNKSGEWEISSTSVSEILDKRGLEASFVTVESLVHNNVTEQVEASKEKISAFCKKYVATNSLEWAKKIVDEVTHIEQLQHSRELLRKVISTEIEPMKKL